MFWSVCIRNSIIFRLIWFLISSFWHIQDNLLTAFSVKLKTLICGYDFTSITIFSHFDNENYRGNIMIGLTHDTCRNIIMNLVTYNTSKTYTGLYFHVEYM